ncbi:MAG TPA: DUF5615 family PIN-like protein [Patescibacteria group bacterium]|nr:DUF5615 family PIN-like protein [Patescibacteria group bacterium]
MNPRMPKFHFYCDENFPIPTGKFLSSKGHNIIYTPIKRKPRKLSDFAQIKEANKHQRIFVSLDKDFKANKNLSEIISKSMGIILIQSSDPRSTKLITILKRHLKAISINKLKGKICRVSIDKINYIKPK